MLYSVIMYNIYDIYIRWYWSNTTFIDYYVEKVNFQLITYKKYCKGSSIQIH